MVELVTTGAMGSAKVPMTIPQQDSGPTSNDLLRQFIARYPGQILYYHIIAQSVEELQNTENAPAISMGPYLLESGQMRLLTSISIYGRRGESREQMRLLYMNAAAIQVWREMGKAPKIIGARVRPPRSALLMFGVPFSQ